MFWEIKPDSHSTLVLKYGTDVVPNLQTVVWQGLPESFVHNLALSFAHKHLSLVVCWSGSGGGGGGGGGLVYVDSKVIA